jgi:hypothetical protein
MTPQVKAQKTRLGNYLTKELGATVIHSQTTSSDYYMLEDIKIRISDHTGAKDTGMVNIYIPFNDPNSFIVENNFTISIIHSLRDVKAFIHSLMFTESMYKEMYRLDIHKELVRLATIRDGLEGENKKLKEIIKETAIHCDSLNKAGFDCITIGGRTYRLDSKAPAAFMKSARNVIKNNNLAEVNFIKDKPVKPTKKKKCKSK